MNKLLREQLTWENILFYFIFCITIIITLQPFFTVNFTCADDFRYYFDTLLGIKQIINESQPIAEYGGRFNYLITRFFYSIPYLVDNFYFTKTIQYLSLLLSFGLFSLLLKKIFNSKWVGLLIFLVLILNLSITQNWHVPITAYPFYFTFSFSLAIASVIFLLKYYNSDKNKFLIISTALYSIAILFYEPFLLFLTFICLFIFIRNCYKTSFIKTLKNKKFYKEILPYIILGILYIIVYFAYRLFYPSTYPGSSFTSDFSIKTFFHIMLQYNKIIIPYYCYLDSRWQLEIYNTLYGGFKSNFFYILVNSNINAIINAIIQVFLLNFIILKIKIKFSYKKLILGIVFSLIFALSAHSLLAISGKASDTQSWWYDCAGYVTSYYSYFGIVAIIVFLMIVIFQLCNKLKIIKIISLLVFSCLLFFISIIHSFNNNQYSKIWKNIDDNKIILDEMLKKDALSNIPNKSIVFLQYQTHSVDEEYIYYYTLLKSPKDIFFAFSNEELLNIIQENPNSDIYKMSIYKDIKSEDIFCTIANISQQTINLKEENPFKNAITKGNINFYFYSASKQFNLVYQYIDSTNTTRCNYLYVDGYNKYRTEKLTIGTFVKDGTLIESFVTNKMVPFKATDTLIIK